MRGAAMRSGIICAFHPAALGSSPKHTAIIILVQFVLYLSLHCEKNENKQKDAGFGPFKNTSNEIFRR